MVWPPPEKAMASSYYHIQCSNDGAGVAGVTVDVNIDNTGVVRYLTDGAGHIIVEWPTDEPWKADYIGIATHFLEAGADPRNMAGQGTVTWELELL